jgi:hypothetical protein
MLGLVLNLLEYVRSSYEQRLFHTIEQFLQASRDPLDHSKISVVCRKYCSTP